MDLKGAKQIKMVGLGDKRQITALLPNRQLKKNQLTTRNDNPSK
jgi:hypothetical protein